MAVRACLPRMGEQALCSHALYSHASPSQTLLLSRAGPVATGLQPLLPAGGSRLTAHAPRGQSRLPFSDVRGSATFLLAPPVGAAPLSWLGKRHFASKFTQTTSNGPVMASPNFRDIERPGNVPEANRAFSYFMVGATGVLGAVSAKATVMNFLGCWGASSEALAMAQVEVDLAAIPEGKSVVIKWRGKPIFIRHRTGEEIDEANAVDVAQLRDPQADADRVKKPEWIVMLGICTHLGCVPLANSGDYNGWYCPCQ